MKNNLLICFLFLQFFLVVITQKVQSFTIVNNISFNQNFYDISSEDNIINVDIDFTSTDSGLDWGQFRIFQPNGIFITLASFNASDIVYGDINNGILRTNLTIPQYTPPGKLQYDYLFMDIDGTTSRTYFSEISGTKLDKDISIINTGSADYIAPSIDKVFFDVDEVFINSEPQTIKAYLDFTENLSGITGFQFRLLSSSGLFLDLAPLDPSKIIEGNLLGGTMMVKLDIPAETENGNLKYDWIIRDKVGNSQQVYDRQIGSQLFPYNNYQEGPLVSYQPSPIPEPATLLLLGFGLLGIAGGFCRKKYTAQGRC